MPGDKLLGFRHNSMCNSCLVSTWGTDESTNKQTDGKGVAQLEMGNVATESPRGTQLSVPMQLVSYWPFSFTLGRNCSKVNPFHFHLMKEGSLLHASSYTHFHPYPGSYVSIYLIFSTTLWCVKSHYGHVLDGETEVQKGKVGSPVNK